MNEAKNMNNVHEWTCGVCGSKFKTLKERVNCEAACLWKLEDEARKAAELKQKEERVARKAEVDNAYTNFIKLRTAYLKDYGTYAYHNNTAPSSEEYDEWVEEVMHQIFG